MNKFRLIIIFILFSTFLFGQTTLNKNSIYLEIAGNGYLGSVNYERQVMKQPGLGLRLGIGTYRVDPFQLTIPMGVNYLVELHNKRSFIDIGFGVTWSRADVMLYTVAKHEADYKNTRFVNYIPNLGYRWITKKNLMWRFNFTPVFTQYGLLPSIGLSFGKQF